MATQPNITPEMLRQMATELELDPDTPGIPAASQIPSTFTITFNGVQFEAASPEELQNKLDIYQEGLRQQARATQVTEHVQEVRKEEQADKRKETDLWVQRFVEDPQGTLNELTEKNFAQYMKKATGMDNWADVQKALAAQAAQSQIEKMQQAFLNRNQDYQVDPQNAQAIGNIMTSNGLQPTLQNLEWAWNEAKRSGAVKPAARAPVANAPPKAPIPMVPTTGADPGTDFMTMFMNTTDPAKQAEMLRFMERSQQTQ